MRRLPQLAALLLATLAFQLVTAQPVPPIAETTLANGLKVLVYEKHSVPVTAVQVGYRVGNHNEPDGVRGIAHFTEHMMFRGSAHYGSLEHSRLINERGGDCTAFTNDDYTAYDAHLPAAELELVFKLEADRMAGLRLDSALLATEANVVKEEYGIHYNDPMDRVMSRGQRLMYGNHPYGADELDLFADLPNLTVAGTRTFFEAHYAPNNAVLIVVGDVRPESVFAFAARWFGPIPAHAVAPEPDLSVPPQAAPRRFRERADLPVPATALAFWLPPARDRDNIPLQVINSILSDGESSRLQKSLVRDRELAVAEISYPVVKQGTGYFGFIVVYLPNVAGRRVEAALWEQLDRLKTEPVTDEELQKACRQLLAAKVFDRYSVHSIAFSLGYAELELGDYHMYQRDIEEFARVTKEDIMRVARKYFTPENATVLTFEPKQANPLFWLAGVIRSVFN